MLGQFEADLEDALGEGKIPGLVVGLTSGESTQYEAAFGMRSTRTSSPMTVDTVFNIASMTKPIAGAAIMQLVEKNFLDLDTPASAIIPYLGEVKVLEGFSATGEAVTRSPKSSITLRHLLTHTSGFSSDRRISTYRPHGIPECLLEKRKLWKFLWCLTLVRSGDTGSV